jgi:hypothetical protein
VQLQELSAEINDPRCRRKQAFTPLTGLLVRFYDSYPFDECVAPTARGCPRGDAIRRVFVNQLKFERMARGTRRC